MARKGYLLASVMTTCANANLLGLENKTMVSASSSGSSKLFFAAFLLAVAQVATQKSHTFKLS